jgi:hypothetical protein
MGMPACGVVSATNKAVAVIPGVFASSTKVGDLEFGERPVLFGSHDILNRPVALLRDPVVDCLVRELDWLQPKAPERSPNKSHVPLASPPSKSLGVKAEAP